MVTFDVKGYEEGQDFEALAKKIKSEIIMDGLVWMDKHEVKPIAFGMKKLQIAMLIEDAKIQTDDVFELIEAWEDDVQSTDILAHCQPTATSSSERNEAPSSLQDFEAPSRSTWS